MKHIIRELRFCRLGQVPEYPAHRQPGFRAQVPPARAKTSGRSQKRRNLPAPPHQGARHSLPHARCNRPALRALKALRASVFPYAMECPDAAGPIACPKFAVTACDSPHIAISKPQPRQESQRWGTKYQTILQPSDLSLLKTAPKFRSVLKAAIDCRQTHNSWKVTARPWRFATDWARRAAPVEQIAQ